MGRLHKALDYAIEAIEWFVVVALVVLSLAAAWTLSLELLELTTHGFTLGTDRFIALINTVLEIFILVELFRIAMAYMSHENVIPTVLEAALVAVARKFVVFEGSNDYLAHAAGLGILILSVAVSWWLLSRARACERGERSVHATISSPPFPTPEENR